MRRWVLPVVITTLLVGVLPTQPDAAREAPTQPDAAREAPTQPVPAPMPAPVPAPAPTPAPRSAPDPPPTACGDAPASDYLDVPAADVHAGAIDCATWWGVMRGFGDGRFGSGEAVTRGQLASMVTGTVLATGASLPAPSGTPPPDATRGPHARPIARLHTAGLVTGFSDGTFRPADPVTRGQAATVLVGLLDTLEIEDVAAPADTATAFDDVAGTTHAAAIAEVAARGLVTGFSDGTFRPADPVTRGQAASVLTRTLQHAVAAGTPVRAASAAVDRDALRELSCIARPYDYRRAELIRGGQLLLTPHPTAPLAPRPTWDEDPFTDRNWRFQYHTLRWLFSLVNAATAPGGERSDLQLALTLARSWVLANPYDDPADPEFSWDDHTAAWRAKVFSCLALHRLEPPDWLIATMQDHRGRLADDDFYVEVGNHALNQDLGLLTLACLTDAHDLRDLASERLALLAWDAVDAEGVNDEQAPEYQAYNYERYRNALLIVEACGLERPDWARRIERMPVVLAHMTQPDGTYPQLGDTDRREVTRRWSHPALRWFITNGREGQPPDETFVTYEAGYTFARSGWGQPGALEQETFLSLRHGPPMWLHGHDDHGSLTLYAQAQPLIVDPGKYGYEDTVQREHVRSRRAHNVVTIGPDCGIRQGDPSRVVSNPSNSWLDRVTVDVLTCPGTRWVRTVAFLRATGDTVVIDEVAGPSDAEVVQHWQLELDAEVAVPDPGLALARWPSGALLSIEQLTEVRSADVVSGGEDPLRGWVAPGYRDLRPAPNLAVVAETVGGRATLVTVLRPGAGDGAPPSTATVGDDAVLVALTTADGRLVDVRIPLRRP